MNKLCKRLCFTPYMPVYKLNKTQHCSFLYFFELIFPLNEPINLYFCT